MKEQIREEIKELVPEYESLRVFVANTTQANDDSGFLSFTFDVRIEIRSPLDQHSVRRYIGGPFDTKTEQNDFVAFLRQTDCPAFRTVSAVQMQLPSALDDSDSGPSILSAGLISGGVVAFSAVLMLAGIFLFVRVRNQRRFAEDVKAEEVELEPAPQSSTKSLVTQDRNDYKEEKNDYMSEVGVETVGNVSSLGDPVPYTSAECSSAAGESTVDYDYNAAYNENAASIVSGSDVSSFKGDTFAMRALMSGDHMYMAEEQFEVIAPEGMLGLILESSMDGVPVVNKVKESSALYGRVFIGDRLLSVDGQDVTGMLASEVSKLIAAKKDQDERKLAFGRIVRTSGL